MTQMIDRRHQRRLRAVLSVCTVSLLMSMALRDAGATGLCENNPKRYSFLAISESQGAVALTVQHAWCEETQDAMGMLGERRGTVTYVELWDLATGDMLERLASPRNTGQGERIRNVAGEFTAVPKSTKITAVLASRGFTTSPQRNKSLNKRCITRASTSAAEASDDSGGFPALAVSVQVLAGKQRLLEHRFTTVARLRKRDLSMVSVFLPARKALAVWARSPMCDGPPPGYFGDGDAGTCYKRDEPVFLLLPLDAHPALAPCFEAAPAAAGPGQAR